MALFGLDERKRMEGRRGRENHVSRDWGRVMEKIKVFMGREDTHRYGNCELDVVLRRWIPQK